jgi:hypothetical protein
VRSHRAHREEQPRTERNSRAALCDQRSDLFLPRAEPDVAALSQGTGDGFFVLRFSNVVWSLGFVLEAAVRTFPSSP